MTIQAELEAILTCLESIGQPLSIGALQNHLAVDMPKKTLQRRLKKLVEHGQVIADGEKKARTYRLAPYGIASSVAEGLITCTRIDKKIQKFRFSENRDLAEKVPQR